MNTENEILGIEEASDAELVVACLGGDRQAFGKIVTRYQRMMCSVAYSALGNIGASEEVAQEAFVEAWKKLDTLREPEKLKSWLCGILRFKISHRRRKEERQPVCRAEELEVVESMESKEMGVGEVAMREEEQALLWQALEKVPETYREALVLYYREHQSVEHVAYELDLSESAVKQRLSRGRKLLQERMMSFVEESLSRSGPSRVFTMGVLAALPSLAPPAKAAGVGVAAAKMGAWLKWSAFITYLASASGLISSFFAVRATLDQARTLPEKRAAKVTAFSLIGVSIGFCVAVWLLSWAAPRWYDQRIYFVVTAVALVFGFVGFFPWYSAKLLNRQRILRTAERLRCPDSFKEERDARGSKAGEYKSRVSLFGVPLVHIRFAMPEVGDPPVFGWIAAGDYAFGLIFAWGGFAVAPVSVGLVTFGALSCGVVGTGVVGIGTIGIGLIAFGGLAIGLDVLGGLFALGWNTALSGGIAVAREAALGGVAMGRFANDERAQELVLGSSSVTGHLVGMGLISLLVIVPVVLYANAVRRRLGKKNGK